MKPKPIIIVQGADFGSEAKGHVAAELCKSRNVDYAVRTGSINAGHTVLYNGKKYKMQQIPTGWVNPNTQLIIGVGTYVHPEILKREVEEINNAMPGSDVRDRLFIDQRCAMHTKKHHDKEQGAKLHERMGSTGEGVAAAIVDKMSRSFDYKLFKDTEDSEPYQLIDTVELLHFAYDEGKQILLEGTQGTFLDFHIGSYPYVTSRQTTASAWVTESGLSPNMEYEIVLVARTHPIRVAGNSGPFPNEISWIDLLRRFNRARTTIGLKHLVSENSIRALEKAEAEAVEELKMPNTLFHMWDAETRKRYSAELSEVHKKALERLAPHHFEDLKGILEMTTVTKKLRRIAKMDMNLLRQSVAINRPKYLALTFLNYEFPQVWGVNRWNDIINGPYGADVKAFVENIEKDLGVPVGYVNTAFNNFIKVK